MGEHVTAGVVADRVELSTSQGQRRQIDRGHQRACLLGQRPGEDGAVRADDRSVAAEEHTVWEVEANAGATG
jgi:hypothetical protein